MKSLLHTLDLESALLMYLFDELPADDRTELEGMLANDGGLRAQLEQLRQMLAGTYDTIVRADGEGEKRMRSIHSAQRAASRLISQWNVRQILEAPPPKRTSGLKKWVLYPAGALAAMLMVGLILWGLFGSTPDVQMSGATNLDDSQREALAELQQAWGEGDLETKRAEDVAIDAAMASVHEDPETGETVVRSFDNVERMIEESRRHRMLNDAEQNLNALPILDMEPEVDPITRLLLARQS